MTPPVAPVLGPHLRELTARETPEVQVELRRMWLPSLTAGLAAGEVDVAITCGLPRLVPFVLQWNPDRALTTAVARFVHTALTSDLPPGWHTQPGHLRHQGGPGVR